MDRRKIAIAALAGAGTIGLLTLGRKQVFLAFDYAKRELFRLALPSAARDYAGAILDASQAAGVSPFITWALGDRESGWGVYLTPKGPHGTGDFTARNWGKSPMPQNADGSPVIGTDGKQTGWGYGLMQLDWSIYPDWLRTNQWWDPAVIIPKGLEELKKHVAFFSASGAGKTVTLSADAASRRGVAAGTYPDPRPLSGDDLWRAALAAYNGGDTNVLRSIAAGKDPDTTTTGKNYSMAVMTKAVALSQKLMA